MSEKGSDEARQTNVDDGDENIIKTTSDDDDDEPPLLMNLEDFNNSLTQGAPDTKLCSPSSSSAKVDNKNETKNEKIVPVTILTGFLGAGKTTLVKYILNSPDHGKRIAVIENEFAPSSLLEGDTTRQTTQTQSLSIEGMIARDGSLSNDEFSPLADLIELPNGCICCTVKDSLVTTLEALIEKQYALDYILIECSGMANPGPIASIFWLDDALESRLKLDGIITMVDAKHILKQLQDTSFDQKSNDADDDAEKNDGGGEAAQQIAYADRIVLNKVDLVAKEGGNSAVLQRVKLAIRSINSSAPMLETNFSKVPDLSWILEANCFDVNKAKEVEEAFSRLMSDSIPAVCTSFNCDDCDDLSHHHDHHHDSAPCTQPSSHLHTSSINNIVLNRSGSVSLKALNRWLAEILWADQDADNQVLDSRLQEALKSAARGAGASSPVEYSAADKANTMKIMRLKGIVSVYHPTADLTAMESLYDDDPSSQNEGVICASTGLDSRKYIVQAVHDLWDIQPCKTLTWDDADMDNLEDDAEPRSCKIVIIGRFLDRDYLEEGFRACFNEIA